MRQDLPGEVHLIGALLQGQITVELDALQKRTGATQAATVEVPDR